MRHWKIITVTGIGIIVAGGLLTRFVPGVPNAVMPWTTLIGATVALVASTRRPATSPRRYGRQTCEHCGHILDGMERCPECGESVWQTPTLANPKRQR